MQSQSHLKGPDSVHICSNDGDSFVAPLGVSESETSQKIHLKKQEKNNSINKIKAKKPHSDGG